jgi:enoyl-CoA hydratase/carnithine racemase
MPIIYSKRGRVAEILFAHPPVNAFDSAGWNSIPEMIHRAGADEDVRCVLIRAEGRGFCGGVDIKEMQAHPERITGLNRGNYLTFKAIRDCAIPVVSALHSFVIGGGVGIAGASDALIAAEGAYLSLPEIDRGGCCRRKRCGQISSPVARSRWKTSGATARLKRSCRLPACRKRQWRSAKLSHQRAATLW